LKKHDLSTPPEPWDHMTTALEEKKEEQHLKIEKKSIKL